MDDLCIADNVITSPLCTAARNGDCDSVRQLLEKGHHVNLNDNRGWTPLHEAVANGHISCANLLLQHDECNKNVITYDGMTPVYVACQYQNNADLIKLLVEHGVSCNQGNTENITPLHVACKFYKFELVRELLKHGANINAQDFNNFTPIMEAIEQISTVWHNRNEIPLELIQFLLKNGSSLTLTDLYGRTVLFIATCVKWKECVQILLQYGSNVDARSTDGGTALLIAAQSGNLDLVKLLLDQGASTDVICDSGTMPLHHALHNGYVGVAEELIKKTDFKSLEKKKIRFESFLILAIDSGSFQSFQLVMKNKIYSPLDSAPFSSDDTCFHHYIFQNPLSFLLSQHIEEPHAMHMVKTLLDSGDFSVNAQNQHFLPPLIGLITASYRNANYVHVDKVKLECFYTLLEKGADIDYNSVKRYPGDLVIPDAVMAVIVPRKCNVQQNLLVPILAQCFMNDWDYLLDWLIKFKTCNATVLKVLFTLGTKSKQSSLKVWESAKHCTCYTCEKILPDVQKVINEKEVTLQSLCRVIVRRWLWQKAGKSYEAKKLIDRMCIPLPVKQYIIPMEL